MVNALTKAFQEFFKILPETVSVYKSVSVKSDPVLKALRNASEQFSSVEAILQNSEDKKDWELLWCHVVAALERELTQLHAYKDELDCVRQRVESKFEDLEKSYFKNRADRLVDVDGALPPVCRLIEIAEDFWRFIHVSLLKISVAMLHLNYSDQSSIEGLINAWNKSLEIPEGITSIMAETNALTSS